MTTKKKTVRTVIFTFCIIVIAGAWRIIQYVIDMQYSKLAPSQLDDDSAYVWMKTCKPFSNWLSFFCIIVILFFVILIIRIWAKKNAPAPEKS